MGGLKKIQFIMEVSPQSDKWLVREEIESRLLPAGSMCLDGIPKRCSTFSYSG